MRNLFLGLIAVALLAGACSTSSQEIDPVAQPAVTDLATRLAVDESAVTVVSVEDVTWSDGSLGCPEPDMMYTQALEEGTLVVLEVDSVAYEYHSGAAGDLFFCENPTPPVSQP